MFAQCKKSYVYGEKKSIKALLDQNGVLVVDKAAVHKVAEGHFQRLFNQQAVISLEIESFLPAQRDVLEELAADFTVLEVTAAFASMGSEKACGGDGIPVELYAYAESEHLIRIVTEAFNVMKAEGQTPAFMKDAIIAMLHKKGLLTDCNNYRGISLLAHIGKGLENVVRNRIEPYAERTGCLPNSQFGFRANRSTGDASFISRSLSSMAREKGVPLFKCFVDLTKAYDKVDRGLCWTVLLRIGIPLVLVNLIRALHDGAQARVRMDGELSDAFALERGLKQGSIFAPLLFNLFFAAIIFAFRDRCEALGVKLRFRRDGNIFDLSKQLKAMTLVEFFTIIELLFADDAELIAESEEELQRLVTILRRCAQRMARRYQLRRRR